jgi:hypothetical protein
MSTASLPPLNNDASSLLGAVRKQFMPEERVAHVAAMIDRLIDLIGTVITVHETNRIVTFSDRLSRQIPTSYAANAFNEFQRALLDTEMTRLVRLWDRPAWSRNSLQTAYWLTVDGEFRAVCDDRLKNSWEPYEGYNRWHMERQERAWRRLDFLAPKAFEAPVFERIENFRHKHLAHSLIQTTKEKAGSVPAPTYRDQRRLLARTIVITRLLDHVVRQSGFVWSGAFEIARNNAESLWNGCTFTVER